MQRDANVKKISGHITKKVADRLAEIFKSDRNNFEEKWDNLKIFVQYGMLSDEKFYERAEKFALLKNVDKNAYTFEEYKTLVGENQKDKNGDVIYLYTSNVDEQYTYIQHAKDKGYDVLLMDGQLDVHVIGQLEQKFEKTRFVRVDSDAIDKIILKDDASEVTLTEKQKDALITLFQSQIPKMDKANFTITFENLSPTQHPIFVTQNEFMRRMKEMSALQGGMASFYGEMPDSYNLVVNTGHPVIEKLIRDEEAACDTEVDPVLAELTEMKSKLDSLKEKTKGKKEEEISETEKAELEELEKQMADFDQQKKEIYTHYAEEDKRFVKLIDLALLAKNMLKGESLSNFVKLSMEM
jgi:molecular chaperone HtpG